MASATCRPSAFPTAPVARPRPLRRLAAAGAAVQGPSASARLAAQLRELKQFKVWNAPASADTSRPAARGSLHVAPARQGAPVDGGARPGAGGARRPGIVWFRGDLRLHDHEALSRAQAECSSLLPVYCFDPRDYGKSPQGYDKTGPYRAQFLAQAVADLRASLRAAGSELVVRLGRPEEVVGELVRRTGAGAVYCHTEVTYEELQVEAAVRAAAEGAGAQLRSFWSATLCHLEDLPFQLSQLPQNFDKFRERAEGVAVRAALAAPAELRGLPLGGRVDPGDIPTLAQLGLQPLPAGCSASSAATAAAAGARARLSSGAPRAGPAPASLDSGTVQGGESEALRQLQRFVAQAAATVCGTTANASGSGGSAAGAGPVTAGSTSGAAYGSNFASSIAPWLATGCLSPRRMLEDVKGALAQAQGQGQGQQSQQAGAAAAAAGAQHPLTWVRFELLWRDFFRFITLRYSSMSARQLGASRAPATAQAAQQPMAATA